MKTTRRWWRRQDCCSSSQCPSPTWPRGVVLAPVRVDTVDPAFDVVLAHAAIAVIAQQEALAGIGHEEPARVKLRRPARVREATPAPLTWRVGWTMLACAPGEGDLGDEIVNATKVTAPRDHDFVFFTLATVPARPRAAGSFRRSRNGGFHGGVGTQAHGATPIAQCGEVVVSKRPHVFATVH